MNDGEERMEREEGCVGREKMRERFEGFVHLLSLMAMTKLCFFLCLILFKGKKRRESRGKAAFG